MTDADTIAARFDTEVEEIGRRAGAALVALWNADAETFPTEAAILLSAYRSDARAAALRWWWQLAAVELHVDALAGIPVGVITADTHGDLGRLADAATTITAGAPAQATVTVALTRLAAGEIAATAQHQVFDQNRRSGAVKGWRRQMDGAACQLCRWWSRDGRIWPTAHPMPKHVGCRCVARPAWSDEIKETRHTKALAAVRPYHSPARPIPQLDRRPR